MKNSMFTNNNDEEDDINIFMTNSKVSNTLLPSNSLAPKIGSTNQPASGANYGNSNSQSNANSGKINDARRILDEAGQKMKDKPLSYGLTSQIGLLNMNSSIGKSSLLGQAIKFENPSPITETSLDRPKNSEVKRDHKNSINPKVVVSKSIKADEIQEVECEITDKKEEKEITNSSIDNVFLKNQVEPKSIPQTETIPNPETLMQKKEASSVVSIAKANELDESNPRVKLYNTILGKDQLDPATLKAFLYT